MCEKGDFLGNNIYVYMYLKFGGRTFRQDVRIPIPADLFLSVNDSYLLLRFIPF